MGKKENAAWVALAFILDIIIVAVWYFLLYPMEIMDHIEAVFSGVLLFIFTLFVLAINATVYINSIAEV